MSNRRSAGFTLVEVLVALTILAISMTVLMSVIATNLDRAREVRDENNAAALLQSLLAQTGTSLSVAPGETSGEFPNGFRWHLDIEPYGTPDERAGWPAEAVTITGTVSWQDGTSTHAKTLTTLRVLPEPAQ
jgi:general secretion pathway protein I